MTAELDLGRGVTARWTSWRQHERVGLIEHHPCGGKSCRGEPCGGSIMFDLPGVKEAFPGRDVWQVESWDPLTITPSVLCGCRGCGHHGYITNGLWVPC